MSTPHQVTAALKAAQGYVAAEIAVLLKSGCLIDEKTQEPRRETMDAALLPELERAERTLAQIDAVLGPRTVGAC